MDDSAAGERTGLLRDAILIAGPTASGKSAAALRVARAIGGAIVNTDSMQAYDMLAVLTARPSEAEMAGIPHHLYGHVHPSVAYSTGAWLRDVMKLIDGGALEGRRPVFVGGTGLYFRALVDGISEMPDIPPHIRDRWRYNLHEKGPEKMHRILRREDPAAAERLRPGDGQRIIRALEVLETSGKSILDWQTRAGKPLIDRASARFFVIEPARPALVNVIEQRFDGMVAAGGMDEARAVGALGLDPALPAMKAIGLRELLAADRGEMTLAEAVERAKIATRQYAKRQSTWFRNQFPDFWQRVGSGGEVDSDPER